MSFCRVLVDEWVRAGVTHAVVAPGSRSTPLAVAVSERLDTTVILDERSASFTALGIGLATGRPAVLVCTSGTAATHFHGAVVEASQANVPLIVCTADRPVELQDVGAPQTIDQDRLYGTAVRWFAAPGVPEETRPQTWRSLASRAVAVATGDRPGPVHLNLAFREPLLEDDDGFETTGRRDGAPWHRTLAAPAVRQAPPALTELCAHASRPLVVTGHLAPPGLGLVGVPVLSDHRGPLTGNVAHWDLLLRDDDFRHAHRPDLVIRAGMPPASKILANWLADLDVPRIALVPPGRWIDPDHRADWVIDGPVELALEGEEGWLASWQNAAARAGGALTTAFTTQAEVSEPAVAARVAATRPAGSTLVVSSSMPVRDLESFAAAAPGCPGARQPRRKRYRRRGFHRSRRRAHLDPHDAADRGSGAVARRGCVARARPTGCRPDGRGRRQRRRRHLLAAPPT